MTFLPEDDQEYLGVKGLTFELKTEPLPDGSDRRGILFPAFEFEGNLYSGVDGQLARCGACDLLIMIPQGYSTTKLDSFYTRPHLKRADGTDPLNASGDSELLGSKWQFWSRHLGDAEWRDGIDGLETFLRYVRTAFRQA